MLVLGRKPGESVIITVPAAFVQQTIEVVFLEDMGKWIKLGFAADPDIRINRKEIEEQRDVR